MEELKEHLPPKKEHLIPKRTEEILNKSINNAFNKIEDLKNNVDYRKKFYASALGYSKDQNPLIASYGEAAHEFAKKGKQADAGLALMMAEVLTQLKELGKEHEKDDWLLNFRAYSSDLLKDLVKGEFTDEQRKAAYTNILTAEENIANTARLDKINYLTARSDRYSQTTKAFLKESIEKIEKLYVSGQIENADSALAILYFYEKQMLRQGIRHGGEEIRSAVGPALEGKIKEAEGRFAKGYQKYQIVAVVLPELKKTLKEMRSQYETISKSLGRSEELEAILYGAEKDIKAIKPRAAHKKIKEFVAAANEFIKKKSAEQLEKTENGIKAILEGVEELGKGLRHYQKLFPSEVSKIIKKMEDLSAESQKLLGDIKKVRENTATPEEVKLSERIQKISSDHAEVLKLFSTSVLIMNEIVKERQFAEVLKISNVFKTKKDYATKHGEKAEEHLNSALAALSNEGSGSQKARSEFSNAMGEKTRVLAMLHLPKKERMLYEIIVENIEQKVDPARREFDFYVKGAIKIYDLCAKGRGFDPTVQKSLNVLFDLESSIRKSDDKFFATGESKLQNELIEASKILIDHYTKALDGEPHLSASDERTYLDTINKNSKKLEESIEKAERINEIVKIAASFTHPIVFATVAFHDVLKEYEIKDSISLSSGLLLAASVIAFRHTRLFKAAGIFKNGMVGKALTATELSIGGVLAAKGGIEAYNAFKEGRYWDGAFTLGMFAIPILYGTVRTPIIKGINKGYRRIASEIIPKAKTRLEALKDVKLPGAFERRIPVRELIMDESGNLVLGKLREIPKVVSSSEVLPEVIRGSGEKYAKTLEQYGLVGKGDVMKNFHETVIANSKIINDGLAGVREKVTYKNDSVLYKMLNGEILEKEEFKSIGTEELEIEVLESSKVGFLILDKGKTWLLNSLSAKGEYGDLGLFAYFKAVKELEGKFGIPTIRTTAIGDEILIIFPEKSLGRMNEYTVALHQTISRIADEMGIGHPLKELIADFSTVEVTARVERIEGKQTIMYGEKPTTLEALITGVEAEHSLARLEKFFSTQLEPFTKLTPKNINIPDIGELQGEANRVITFRLEFNPEVNNALNELAKMNKKGVSAVETNLVGPSVLNQLGHPVTDFYSNAYLDALQTSFNNHDLPIKIYRHGPMTAAFKYTGVVDNEKLQRAIKEAEKAFTENISHTGVKNVRTFLGRTKDEAANLVAQRIINPTPTKTPLSVTSEAYKTMKQIVAVLHLEPEQFLKDKAIDQKVKPLLDSVKNEPWVRNPEDLIYFLRANGVPLSEIESMLRAFGVSLK